MSARLDSESKSIGTVAYSNEELLLDVDELQWIRILVLDADMGG